MAGAMINTRAHHKSPGTVSTNTMLIVQSRSQSHFFGIEPMSYSTTLNALQGVSAYPKPRKQKNGSLSLTPYAGLYFGWTTMTSMVVLPMFFGA
jgi:hypothetical protein